jgi:hypothetical protein
MKALVRSSAGGGDMRQALQHWLDLTRDAPTALVDSGTLIRLATDLLEQGDREPAVRALRQCVDPGNSALSAGLALRAADMARELDPPTALRAARRALDFPDMHEAKRARIQDLIGELEAVGVSVAPDVFEEEAALEEARAQARRPIEIADWEPELPGGAQVGGPVPVLPPVPMAGGDVSPLPVPPPPVPGSVRPAVATPPRLELSAEGELEPAAEAAAAVPLPPAQMGVPPPIPVSPVQPPPVPVPPATHEPEPGGRAPEDAIARRVMGAIEGVPRFAAVKLVEASPTSFESDTLRLRVSEGRKAKVEYAKIDAVAAALVRGLAPKPVLVIDLLLNWSEFEEVPLRVIRLCSTGFDPRVLIAGVEDPTEAYRALVSRILDASDAIALPDPEAARGRPFRVFEDLASYQRAVLQVSC